MSENGEIYTAGEILHCHCHCTQILPLMTQLKIMLNMLIFCVLLPLILQRDYELLQNETTVCL